MGVSAVQRNPRLRLVRQADVIHEDEAPTAFLLIDDFQDGLLALQVGHIPALLGQGIRVVAGAAAHHLATDRRFRAGPVGVGAAARSETECGGARCGRASEISLPSLSACPSDRNEVAREDPDGSDRLH